MIQQAEGLSAIDALIKFYNSRVYSLLEREETKVWYNSSWQLYEMYREEKSREEKSAS